MLSVTKTLLSGGNDSHRDSMRLVGQATMVREQTGTGRWLRLTHCQRSDFNPTSFQRSVVSGSLLLRVLDRFIYRCCFCNFGIGLGVAWHPVSGRGLQWSFWDSCSSDNE